MRVTLVKFEGCIAQMHVSRFEQTEKKKLVVGVAKIVFWRYLVRLSTAAFIFLTDTFLDFIQSFQTETVL
jgi:hypothetical protein